MKVSRNAWHYRLNSWARGWRFDQRVADGQHTTCSYFWSTLGSLAMITIFAIVCLGVGGMAISGLIGLGMMGLAYLGLIAAEVPVYFQLMGVMVGIMLAAGVIGKGASLVALYIAGKLDEWEERALALGDDAPKEPGFIRQFLKDKKEKVCTIVRVE